MLGFMFSTSEAEPDAHLPVLVVYDVHTDAVTYAQSSAEAGHATASTASSPRELR